jgi:hypothetical protein
LGEALAGALTIERDQAVPDYGRLYQRTNRHFEIERHDRVS